MKKRYSVDIKTAIKRKIYENHNYVCYLCGKKVKIYDGGREHDCATLDHFIPKCILKGNTQSNLRTCCAKCNNIEKKDKFIVGYSVIVSYANINYHRIYNVCYFQEKFIEDFESWEY